MPVEPPPSPASDSTIALPGATPIPAADQTVALDASMPAASPEQTMDLSPAAAPATGATVQLGPSDPGVRSDATVSPEEASLSAGNAAFSVASRAADIRPAQADPRWPLMPGYEILGELGRGAMGVVYRARQTGLERLVALKMILSGGHASEAEIVRFRTEAQAVARIQHPHIVGVYEIGEHAGLPYFSLEFVDGGCLADKLAENALPVREAARVVRQLAQGMDLAHSLGIIHRDLKPANVLLTRDGTPKITDFGLAKKLEEDSSATRAGAIMGTPSYMAPEQAEGRTDSIGPPADIYALGAILYDLLTGRPPFKGSTILDTLNQVRTLEPVPPARLSPQMPRDLETICLKCLQKDPARRYRTAGDLAEDLRRFLDGEPVIARPVPGWERAWKWCRRNPALAALVGVSASFVVSLGIGGIAWGRSERARAIEANLLRQQAEEERNRAAENFDAARDAVDQMLTRVGNERLEYEPRMEQVRRDLLEKAVTFYDRFLRSEGDSPAIRHEAALASRQVGRIRAMLGQVDAAERSWRKALELLEDLVSQNPSEVVYQKDLAAVSGDLADLLRRGDRFADAEGVFARTIEILEQLRQQVPDDRVVPRDLATAHYNLGLLHADQARPAEAEKSYRLAMQLQGQLTEAIPAELGYRQELARTWTALGKIQARDRPAEAEKSLRQAKAYFEQLTKQRPEVPDFRQELLLGCRTLADLLRDRRPNEAEALLQQAIGLGAGLMGDFPTVPQYQQSLAECLDLLGSLWQAAGKRPEAGAAYQRSLDLKEKLASNFPRKAEYRRALARGLGNQGQFLQTSGRMPEARQAYTRSVELLRGVRKEHPGTLEDEKELGLALSRLGIFQTADPAQAVVLLREALELQSHVVERDATNRDARAERARTCSALATLTQLQGQGAEAEKRHRQAEADLRELRKHYPEEPEYRQSLAMTLLNLADLFKQTKRPVEAEKAGKESVELLGALAREQPGQPVYRREQARAWHNLGVLYLETKRPLEAESAHKQALQLRRDLVERHPAEPSLRHELASSHAELAIAFAHRNNHKASEDGFRQAVGLLDKLVAEQPETISHVNDLQTQLDNLAQLLKGLGRDDEAIRCWRQRISVKRLLAEKNEARPAYRSEVGRALHELAMQQVEFGRKEDAAKTFREAIQQQQMALESAPRNEAFRQDLCQHHLGLADTLLAGSDHKGAAGVIEQVQTLAPASWPQWPMAALLLARCAGLASEDEKQARIYGDRALLLLGKAKEAGFRDGKALAEMKEFAPLRKREDFRRLVEELSAKK